MAAMWVLILSVLQITGAYAQEMAAITDWHGNLVWWDQGSGANRDFSCRRPKLLDTRNWFTAGHNGQGHYGDQLDIRAFSLKANSDPTALAAASRYETIWDDSGSGADMDGTVVRPICPGGYVSLGDVMYGSHGAVPGDLMQTVRCVKEEYTEPCGFGDEIWADHGSGAHADVKMLAVRCTQIGMVDTGFFYASNSYTDVPDTQAYGLKAANVAFWA